MAALDERKFFDEAHVCVCVCVCECVYIYIKQTYSGLRAYEQVRTPPLRMDAMSKHLEFSFLRNASEGQVGRQPHQALRMRNGKVALTGYSTCLIKVVFGVYF